MSDCHEFWAIVFDQMRRPWEGHMCFNPKNLLTCLMFLLGISDPFLPGLYTSLVPMYNAEVSTKNIRGAVGTINNLASTVGMLVAQVLSLNELLGREELWPVLMGMCAQLLITHQTYHVAFTMVAR